MPTAAQRLARLGRTAVLSALLLPFFGPAWARADDAAAKPAPEAPAAPAAPNQPAPDPDLPLLGEFVGPVAKEASQVERLCLQIRPIGGGRFEALQFNGNLPGEKVPLGPPLKLIGQRFADYLILSGGPGPIIVASDHCLILSREGQHLGRLERIHRQSPTLGALPPKEAIVLFDGSGTEQFTTAEITEDGLLMEGADVNPLFQDFNLHAEFMLPYMPACLDQARGNSGLYLMSRYEVQVLDSFATEPVFNGCGSLYRTRTPDVNACLPPLVWQTYDIIFTAPRWAADGSKLKNARITVWLNGVKVHDNVEIAAPTGNGKPEDPLPLPLRFQNHKDPVRYRNIWIVDRGAVQTFEFPVYPKPGEAKPQAKPAEAKKDQPEPKKTDEKKADKPAEAKPQVKPAPQTKPVEAKKDQAKPKKPDEKKPAEKKADKPAETQPQAKPTPQAKPAEVKKDQPEPKQPAAA